jgi:hypothetical protein
MVTLAKHRTPKVHFKIEAAAEHLASVPGATLQTAAKHCGLTVPKLRDLLKQPHNLSYVKQVRDLAIEALTTNGPATLAAVIKEGSNQMAVVQATKAAMSWARESDEATRRAANRSLNYSPGLCIVIGSPSPMIEQRLAGARTVEALAYERGPPDEDLVDNVDEDDALDVLPPPVRAPAKPAVRRKSPSASKARQ